MTNIYWVGAFPPEVPSVGDHAQTVAVQNFLKDHFSDFTTKKFTRSPNNIKAFFQEKISSDDLIFIHSSGDFGDLYPTWHQTRKRIISKHPHNRIVQLPVSVKYNSPATFEEDKAFFSDKPNLTILCRTPQDAKLLQENFSCHTEFFPDFVFYLKPSPKNYPRKEILVALRKDSESTLHGHLDRIVDRLEKPLRLVRKITKKDVVYIAHKTAKSLDQKLVGDYIQKKLPEAVINDIQTFSSKITDSIREYLINDILDYYQHCKLVITDRFHACVFAHITDTPCLPVKGKIEQKTFVDTTLDYDSYFRNFRAKIVCAKTGMQTHKSIVNPFNDPLDIIMERRSYRSWTKETPTPYEINTIIEAGTYAPSGANTQAVRFKVCIGDLAEELCKRTSPWFRNSPAPAVIIVLYNTVRARACGLTQKWHERLMWQDTACAMQNMMLQAEALGLQTCWGTVNPQQQKAISRVFHLPNEYTVCSLLLLGHSNQIINIRKAIHQGRKIDRRNQRIP